MTAIRLRLRALPSSSRRIHLARGTAVVVFVFVVIRVSYWLSGGGFSLAMFSTLWQLLDIHELVAHPFQSVALLHTQPPLFNLFVGSILRWSPLSDAVSFQVVYFACGLVLVVALRSLLVELGFAPVAATIGASVVACDPVMLSYENTITYELPVAMLLVVSGLLCARYATSRRQGTLVGFALVMTVIVMTRALLHPIWLLACLALVIVSVCPRPTRTRVAATCAIPIVVAGGWMLKNQILFDNPTLSSWFGMNAGRGVIAPMPRHDVEALIRQGRLSPTARIRALSPYSAYAPYFGPCHTDFDEPVLRSLRKRNGQANFNAACYLPVYRDAEQNALDAIVEEPGLYLRGRGAPIAAHFFHDLGPGLLRFRDNDVIRVLSGVYDPVSFAVHIDIHDRGWTNPLFPGTKPWSIPMSITLELATAVVVARGAASGWRLVRSRGSPGDTAWAYLGITVAYVTFVSIGTEFGENSRFRFLIDPILIGVLAAQAVTAARALVGRRTRGLARDPG